MALIRKEIHVEAKVGDIVKAPKTVYRDDLTLFICHIEDDLLFVSDDKNATKNECEVSCAEYCYLV